MSKGAQIAIAMVTVFGGLAWILSSRDPGAGTFQYYENVSAFLSAPMSAEGRNASLRVHGFVVEGSIQKDLPAGHVDFRIRDRQTRVGALRVRFLGLDVPDLFKDGAEVVVEGRYAYGRFDADRVLAKCPSKYETQAAGPSA